MAAAAADRSSATAAASWIVTENVVCVAAAPPPAAAMPAGFPQQGWPSPSQLCRGSVPVVGAGYRRAPRCGWALHCRRQAPLFLGGCPAPLLGVPGCFLAESSLLVPAEKVWWGPTCSDSLHSTGREGGPGDMGLGTRNLHPEACGCFSLCLHVTRGVSGWGVPLSSVDILGDVRACVRVTWEGSVTSPCHCAVRFQKLVSTQVGNTCM